MDPFWGVGGDKYDGENQFGKALMVVRDLLRTKSFPKGMSLLRPPKILFYHHNQPYYGFTNFSRHPIDFNGIWKTSEHLFQAFKVQYFSLDRIPDLYSIVLGSSTDSGPNIHCGIPKRSV